MVKAGDARVAMIGFPSVGKSTLLGKLTQTASAMGAYEFTTLTCIPGNIEYRDARIQLLDLPGIIEGASGGTFIVHRPALDAQPFSCAPLFLVIRFVRMRAEHEF